jgi:hypothetical protein
MNPLDLIDFIVWYATTRGEVLTPIRLVKFLYLADLYHARQTQGRTTTGWPWAFVHYGPFCGQALDAIETAVQQEIIEALPYQSRYDGEQHFVYRSPSKERPRAAEILPVAVAGALQAAIAMWAGDTAGLLDYVYFETEPMVQATPRQRLDFSVAHWPSRPEPVAMKRLSPKVVAQAKEALARLRARTALGLARSREEAEGEIRDEAYRAFLERLESVERLVRGKLEGMATLDALAESQPEDES